MYKIVGSVFANSLVSYSVGFVLSFTMDRSPTVANLFSPYKLRYLNTVLFQYIIGDFKFFKYRGLRGGNLHSKQAIVDQSGYSTKMTNESYKKSIFYNTCWLCFESNTVGHSNFWQHFSLIWLTVLLRKCHHVFVLIHYYIRHLCICRNWKILVKHFVFTLVAAKGKRATFLVAH